MEKIFLESIIKQFEYYKLLEDKTFTQLKDKDLCRKFNTDTNSIVTIIKHLSGNMLSRWTDFLTTDGEKNGVTEMMNLQQIYLQKMKF